MLADTAPPTTLSESLLLDIVSPKAHFVETRIGDGRGVELALKFLEPSKIHTCDQSEEKVALIKSNFSGVEAYNCTGVEFLNGINFLNPKSHSIFWLDFTPQILDELEIIFAKFFSFRSIILIDNIHTMLFSEHAELESSWIEISKFLSQIPNIVWSFHANSFGHSGAILLLEHE